MEKIQNKVFKSAKEGTLFVANQIKNLIEEKASKGEHAVLGLATGVSPIYLYRELVKMHDGGLSFSNVITFNLDEYYPMDPNALQSYVKFMHEQLFNHVDIKPENIHIPDGTQDKKSVVDFCFSYEEKIDKFHIETLRKDYLVCSSNKYVCRSLLGSIEDESLNGKIRVSIVATSLDGHKPESKTVLNMVNRIQNRNPGYSDNIFKNPNIDQNALNSIDGATALKLDEQLEMDTTPTNVGDTSSLQGTNGNINNDNESNPYGISIENASYIENNIEVENTFNKADVGAEHTPKLFTEEDSNNLEEEDIQNDKLFNQSSLDDEEFEIPAFLRKQKF